MNNQALEVKWVRADARPDKVVRNLSAIYQLILEARHHSQEALRHRPEQGQA